MIKELKANTTYKLVDKDGWFKDDDFNESLYTNYFTSTGFITIAAVYHGEGFTGDQCIITEDEYQFFEEVVTPTEGVQTLSTPTITPLPSIFVRGEEWLVATEHPTQEGKVICVRVSDNCIDCFDSIFIDEKLNPKSWQENIETHLGFEYSRTCKSFYISKRTLSEDELISMAKRIIELSQWV